MPFIRTSDVVVSEADGTARIPLTLSAPSETPVSVDVATSDGTGDAFLDVASLEDTITFEPGQTQAEVTVGIFNDDEREPQETINVDLSNSQGADLARESARLTIVDNDPSPAMRRRSRRKLRTWLGRIRAKRALP